MRPGIPGQGFESDVLDSCLGLFCFTGGGVDGGSYKPDLLVSSHRVPPQTTISPRHY